MIKEEVQKEVQRGSQKTSCEKVNTGPETHIYFFTRQFFNTFCKYGMRIILYIMRIKVHINFFNLYVSSC